MPKKELLIKNSVILTSYLLVTWGFYRFIFKLPEEIEDLVVKPILWLVPVIYFVRKEKRGLKSLGITDQNLFPTLYFSLSLGVIFAMVAVLVNFIKYQNFNFVSLISETPFFVTLGLSFVTAITEEVTFRGYLFNRVWEATGGEWKANLLTSFAWALIHIPIAIFWWKLDSSQTLVVLLLTTLFGIGSAFVFARTKNVFASILLHVFWGWPIVLFR